MSTVLFVYGTLAPGEPSWPVLRPYVIDARPNAAPGRLFDTGRGYPAAVFAPGAELVQGWTCALADPPIAALESLDAFEGHEYERISVLCTDGTAALAYQYVAPLDRCTPVTGGSWFAHR